ncbi:hypothetical protein ANCCEY_03771 [Ancylostoma ceylanicum]|uniref:Uncharacterized protein n=1 Tax=Ancylostoma ceylanicum TaxID=53326 RepID=A0A0D6LYL0_9BILA|nr:hypothetical protein ANCCEY_03771 [Ancylostoma ceylanicum]
MDDKYADKKKDGDEKKKIEEVNPAGVDKERKSTEKMTVQKEKEIITNVIVKKEYVQAPQAFEFAFASRPDSKPSGQPQAKSLAPTLNEKTPQGAAAQKTSQTAAGQKPGAAAQPAKPGEPAKPGAATAPKPGAKPAEPAKPGAAAPPKPGSAPPPKPGDAKTATAGTAAAAKPPAKGLTAAQKKEIEKIDEDLLGGAKTCRVNVQFQKTTTVTKQ